MIVTVATVATVGEATQGAAGVDPRRVDPIVGEAGADRGKTEGQGSYVKADALSAMRRATLSATALNFAGADVLQDATKTVTATTIDAHRREVLRQYAETTAGAEAKTWAGV